MRGLKQNSKYTIRTYFKNIYLGVTILELSIKHSIVSTIQHKHCLRLQNRHEIHTTYTHFKMES